MPSYEDELIWQSGPLPEDAPLCPFRPFPESMLWNTFGMPRDTNKAQWKTIKLIDWSLNKQFQSRGHTHSGPTSQQWCFEPKKVYWIKLSLQFGINCPSLFIFFIFFISYASLVGLYVIMHPRWFLRRPNNKTLYSQRPKRATFPSKSPSCKLPERVQPSWIYCSPCLNIFRKLDLHLWVRDYF